MAARSPQLDRTALQRLRTTVKAMRSGPRRSLPVAHLLQLAATAPAGAGITIDFDASRDLGHELIVVRLAPADAACGTDPRLEALSRREREVAGLIATGLSNKDIAARLSIASSTVKDHVHHILQKTGFRNRAAVAGACRRPAHR
jgi:DNA-binding NarL/FixJ family response regulator